MNNGSSLGMIVLGAGLGAAAGLGSVGMQNTHPRPQLPTISEEQKAANASQRALAREAKRARQAQRQAKGMRHGG